MEAVDLCAYQHRPVFQVSSACLARLGEVRRWFDLNFGRTLASGSRTSIAVSPLSAVAPEHPARTGSMRNLDYDYCLLRRVAQTPGCRKMRKEPNLSRAIRDMSGMPTLGVPGLWLLHRSLQHEWSSSDSACGELRLCLIVIRASRGTYETVHAWRPDWR